MTAFVEAPVAFAEFVPATAVLVELAEAVFVPAEFVAADEGLLVAPAGAALDDVDPAPVRFGAAAAPAFCAATGTGRRKL